MLAGEITGQRARRIDVHAPIDCAYRGIERRVARRFELRHDQEHSRGDAGFEAGAIRDCERARELDTERAFTDLGRAERRQLTRQQVSEAARTRGHEAMGGRSQLHESAGRAGSGVSLRSRRCRVRMR